MEKLNRGDKIYVGKDNEKESVVNTFLSCRDGIVKCYEYNSDSGYGSKTRLFLCEDYKHESMCIVRQTWIDFDKYWIEEALDFDSDSFVFLAALATGDDECSSGTYTLVRDS